MQSGNHSYNIMKQTIRSYAKAAIYPFFRIYFAIRAWWPVWFFVLNRDARARFAKHRRTLNAVQKRIADDLGRDGVAVTHIDELFPGKNLLPHLQGYVRSMREAPEVRAKKAFLIQLWDTVPLVDLANPFLEFVLAPRMLDIVNTYMQMQSVFYYLTLNVTTPVPSDSPAVSSQRWHRDPEDKKMCKVFLYVNDVDEGAGPFTYILGSQHGGRYGGLFPQRPPKGVYPAEDMVASAIPASAIRRHMGKAGTVVFADTAGLHRGGYATKAERIMFTAGFSSPHSVWPIRFHYAPSFDVEYANITDPGVRFALAPRRDSFSTWLFERLGKVYKF